MTTNASTWFYHEPEHRAYLIEERVNHTFWSNRINGVHLKCIEAEPPFTMTGEWDGLPINLKWLPAKYLILSSTSDQPLDALLIGIKEILGFSPTLSYVDSEGKFFAEWRTEDAQDRVQEIKNNAQFKSIKLYK